MNSEFRKCVRESTGAIARLFSTRAQVLCPHHSLHQARMGVHRGPRLALPLSLSLMGALPPRQQRAHGVLSLARVSIHTHLVRGATARTRLKAVRRLLRQPTQPTPLMATRTTCLTFRTRWTCGFHSRSPRRLQARVVQIRGCERAWLS